jgi:hypothetical protein
MSSTLSAVALLLLIASAVPARDVVHPAAAVPEAVLAHPAAQTSLPAQAVPRWSAQALASWAGPWEMRPGLYDHRYITW